MNVYIITEAGREFGYGHLTRCIALYQALREEGFNLHLMVHGDHTVENIISGYDHEIVDWLSEESLWNTLDSTGIVIIDSYVADLKVYQKISDWAFLSVYIDDNNRITYPKGIVVNGTIYASELNFRRDQDHMYLLGEKYVFLRKEFWEMPNKNINKDVEKILVTVGDKQYPGWAQSIKEKLSQQFSFQFDVIDPTERRASADEMKTLMLDTDICISAGGQTTNELARIGVPTIGVCAAENQRLNLKKWHEMGFIEYAGWIHAQDLKDNLTASIQKLLPFEERLKRSEIGMGHVDGRGVHRIALALKENLVGIKS